MRSNRQILGAYRLSPEEHLRASAALRRGPWCWPSSTHPRARALSGLASPPEPRQGEVLVITESPHQQSAWVASVHPPEGLETGILDNEAQAALRLARWLLGERATLAWRPIPGAETLTLQRIDVQTTETYPYELRPVRGSSLGLSCILALASALYDRPLMGGVIASASLTETGHLLEVGGVEAKARAIESLLPGIGLVVVSHTQADRWREALRDLPEVTVRGFETAWEAISALIHPERTLAQTPEENRPGVLYALGTLIHRQSDTVLQWRAVHRAVQRIKRAWPLSPDEENELHLVQVVASRYAEVNNREELPHDLVEWTSRQPPLARAVQLAHLVQHHADLAIDIPPSLLAQVRPLLDADSAPHAWAVRGAWGRWLAHCGSAGDALALQREITTQMYRMHRADQCSYGLAEWLRLAGAMGDATEFQAALEMERTLISIRALTPADRIQIDAAVGGAAALLGEQCLSDNRLARIEEARRLPGQAILRSRLIRLKRLASKASDPYTDLLPPHRALDRLRRGVLDLESALSSLGRHSTLGARLALGGTRHLLRFYSR